MDNEKAASAKEWNALVMALGPNPTREAWLSVLARRPEPTHCTKKQAEWVRKCLEDD